MPSTPAASPLEFVRRHARRVLLQAVIVAAVAGLASLLLPDQYTASTVLLPQRMIRRTESRAIPRACAILRLPCP